MLPPCISEYVATINYATSEAVYKPVGSMSVKKEKLQFSKDAPIVIEYKCSDPINKVSQKIQAVFGHVRRRPTPCGAKPTWMNDLE